MTPEPREPIAIVGIGCRLPGGADSPEALWDLLREGVDAISPIPPDRFGGDDHVDEHPATPGKIMSGWGGFVDDISEFDAGFFEMAPRQAECLDPQHRLLLETAWESLEDAGVPRESLAGTNTGVYVGMWTNEYDARMFADLDRINFHTTTGTGRYAASGRLSYFLDVLGPSITLDTACSSSLAAVHLACRGLLAGECDVALAGGVNLIVEPFISIAYSQSRMMAPDGRCKFGDATGNGYVRSDGSVMITLKRLSTAQAAGDHVYAVIRGTAVTNDGRSSGLLGRPGQGGQEEMLRRAYASAGVDPATIQYVEAHGTGTAAGDPVELGALGVVVGTAPGRTQPCLVGSIKTNIGHTEGAAGAAGLVKLALALEHGEIPASLHFTTPNPNIPWSELGVLMSEQHQPWPSVDGVRRGGVSAYGIAGTNADAVLEQAPAATGAPRRSITRSTHVLPISAASAPALRALAGRYAALLDEGVDSVDDLCAAAATRRSHLGVRLAVVGSNAAELAASLRTSIGVADEQLEAGSTAPGRQAVFVFPGQGSQWEGMARELLAAEPVFADAMAHCDDAIRSEAGWSPLDALAGANGAQPTEIDVVQPLLFAIEVSLAALWTSWGITPVAVVGHSMGEVAAAHVAGALSLNDAVAVICRRSSLLRRISGQGAMALVELPVDGANAAIAGREAALSVAVSNSPRSTVISGDPAALDEIVERLTAEGVFCRPVNVDVASHSPQVEPLMDELRARLADIRPRSGTVPFRSTVAGVVLDGSVLDADYWASNLRRPVLFGEAIAELASTDASSFIELSPHPILLPSIEQVLRGVETGGEPAGQVVASMRRDVPEQASMLTALASLFESGASVDWQSVTGEPARHTPLPHYPWQREHHWYTPSAGGHRRMGGHPLLGESVTPADDPSTVFWQTTLDGDELAFLRDHVVQGSAVLPATGFIELARLAICEGPAAGPTVSVTMSGLRLHEALPIDAAHPRDVQITVDRTGGRQRCRIWSRERDPDASWTLHAEVEAEFAADVARGADVDTALDAATNGTDGGGDGSMADIRDRCPTHRDAEGHLVEMRRRELTYAGVFRSVGEVWIGDREAIGRIETPAPTGGSSPRRIAALDGCLQVALASLPRATAALTFLPTAAQRVVLAPLDDIAWCHAVVTSVEDDRARVDLTATDATGRTVVTIEGLELRKLGTGEQRLRDLLFELEWIPAPIEPGDTDTAPVSNWIVYAHDDVGDDVVDRLRRAGNRCVVVRPGTTMAFDGDEIRIDPVRTDDHRAALLRSTELLGDAAGVVYAWGAGVLDVDADTETLGFLAPVALVQALTSAAFDAVPRLWLVTRGAHRSSPAQALLWGFGRVAANEEPGLRCTLVDLPPGVAGEAELFDELRHATADQQVAFVDGVRHVARLERSSPPALAAARTTLTDSYRLAAAAPGLLDTLRPRMHVRVPPRDGEVEVRVTSAALNFLDVLKAMGIYPGIESSSDTPLGAECAGVVVGVGEGVSHVAVGDEVVAITPSYGTASMLASYVTVPGPFVQPRPASIQAVAASAASVAYITGYYSLCELARVRAGETVLIHSATGGVGLAAIELCRHLGAEVIATAGSDRKRAHLRALGVEHVFDSRTTGFAAAIREVTNGRGVDVVLNSLVGEAIPAGFSVLAPGGRFVEIGKRDVFAHSRLDLALFKNNIALFVADLASLTEDDPSLMASMFAEVTAMIADGRLAPLPTTASPLASAADAFRTMANADHIGKLVLTMPSVPISADAPSIRPDSTYLITGGLGSLGLAIAARLVDRGARHLALIGRREPGPEAAAAIAALRERGAEVLTARADVSRHDELRDRVAALRDSMPPLRGVIHAAGVLADATIGAMDEDGARRALAPKLHGAWNLHRVTVDDPLDHFVMFSSVAGVLGLTGQSNYAAGNAFLDSLAAHRRSLGRPARSIQWGPWGEIGLAASAEDRGGRLARRGLDSLDPAEALDVFDMLLDAADGDLAVMRLDAATWAAADPATAPLLGDLVGSSVHVEPATMTWRELAMAAPAGARRRRTVEDVVCAALAAVLRVQSERIDRHQPVKSMGLDSLMALELRNHIEAATGLTLSATLVWNYPTVTLLAEHLAATMGIPLDADDVGAPVTAVEAAPVAASQAELEALLADELAAVDRLLDVEGGSR